MTDLQTLLREVLEDPKLAVAPEIQREAVLHPGVREEDLDGQGKKEIFEWLPPEHQTLLRRSNGLEILGGSYRLFGIEALVDRNRPETWKFAWNGVADEFLCFGESVLGNQDAYRWDELQKDVPAPVYELYAVTMEPIVTHASFQEFLQDRFVSLPDDPYHARIRRARERFGDFPLDQHLVYVPSPLLVEGRVDLPDLMRMDAKSALIVNGDMASQLAWRQDLEGLLGVETYRDEQGRERVRVRWEEPGQR